MQGTPEFRDEELVLVGYDPPWKAVFTVLVIKKEGGELQCGDRVVARHEADISS